jgi:predicted P-loop ATPase
MVPVLVGPQGTGKTSLARAIAPTLETFLELDLGKDSADIHREMRGKLIVELGELRGMRQRELAHVKAFISAPFDEFVDKWEKQPRRYPRRSVFIGTVNDANFLPPDDEHRRWLPMTAPQRSKQARNTALNALDKVRDQLWAEALATFKRSGIAWQTAEELARTVHAEFEDSDPWQDGITRWLDHQVPDQECPLTTALALAHTGLNTKDTNPGHARRMAAILRKLGYTEARTRIGESSEKVRHWVRKGAL